MGWSASTCRVFLEALSIHRMASGVFDMRRLLGNSWRTRARAVGSDRSNRPTLSVETPGKYGRVRSARGCTAALPRKVRRRLTLPGLGDMARASPDVRRPRGTPPSRSHADPETVVGNTTANKAAELRLRSVRMASPTSGRVLPVARSADEAPPSAAVDPRAAPRSVREAAVLRRSSSPGAGGPSPLPSPAPFAARAWLLGLGRATAAPWRSRSP